MSAWIKGLGLAIVIVSILEMLLPNNKTKKYIRMVMGIYVLFTIVSPFIKHQDVFKAVKAQISDEEEETKITKIKIKVQKSQEEVKPSEEEKIENKVVTEIQKIKPIDTSIQKQDENKKEENEAEDKKTKINRADIQNIKKFLIEEYGVNEKCLEIN